MSSALLMKLLFLRKRKQSSSMTKKSLNESLSEMQKTDLIPKRPNGRLRSKDFKDVCRVCMQTSTDVISLFGSKAEESKLVANIHQCARVTILPDDQLPQNVCSSCCHLLLSALLFKVTCEASDNELRRFLASDFVEETEPVPSDLFLKRPEILKYDQDLNYLDSYDDPVDFLPQNDDDSDFRPSDNDSDINEFSVTEKADDLEDVNSWNATKLTAKGERNVLVRNYTKRPAKTHCVKCNEKFESSFDYKIHVLTDGHKKKPWQCVDCGKVCDSRTSYDNHLRVHTLERPFICDVCGKAFTQVGALTMHMMIHTNAFPFACSQCPHKCRTKHTLLQHMRVHSGEKPFKCPHCPKTFSNRSNQRLHSLKHFNPKPFECELCGKAYAFRQAYKDHKYTVHENKRYECATCGATMCHLKNLREHERRVHKRKKRPPGVKPAYLRQEETL